jgi:hypothetical protein
MKLLFCCLIAILLALGGCVYIDATAVRPPPMDYMPPALPPSDDVPPALHSQGSNEPIQLHPKAESGPPNGSSQP